MNSDWIDDEGFRANVGIILTDHHGKLMIAGRVGSKGWQFPQGGMLRGENGPRDTRWLRWFAELPAAFLLAIVLLAVARPF